MPRIQQAYVYVTCLVAIHMAVLGAANVLRVLAELALQAPSGTFLGLPFIFAEGGSTPASVHREQMSLALALLLIGGPAWALHWRSAQRASRAEPDRRSPIRAFYLYLVMFVTALLVFFHLQFAISTFLSALLGPGQFPGPGAVPVEDLPRHLVALLSMVLVAGATWWYHRRIAAADRGAVAIVRTPAEWRRAHEYGLILVGLFSVIFAATSIFTALWDVAFDTTVLRTFPGGFNEPAPLERLRGLLPFSIPTLVTGLALWLIHWIPARRMARAATAEGEDERRSVIPKIALYFVAFASAISVLVSLSFALVGVIRQLLGDPDPGSGRPLLAAAGGPLAQVVILGVAWVYHRRVLEEEAARQPELRAQADMRRLYYYVVSALALAMIAIGCAGVVGVVGSYAMGYVTHDAAEIATYASLVAVGLPFWAFHWTRIERHLWRPDDPARAADERRANLRRGYLYVAMLGGGLALLVAGAAALFQIINGLLATDLSVPRLHDIWHLVVDAGVGAAVANAHWRLLRADRDALAEAVVAAPVAAASPASFAFVVTIEADDAATARARLEAALPGTARIEGSATPR